MIIGYDTFGMIPFGTPAIPLLNGQYLEIKNMVIDELHVQSGIVNNSEKQLWENNTIFIAKFQDDLEAGNIGMRGNAISLLRIKRRNIKKSNFLTLKEIPFNPDPTFIEYRDFTAAAAQNYEYAVAPVDDSGIEGAISSVNVSPNFTGWWLIDLDNPEEYSFQFVHNLDDVNITTDEDRTELSTFSKYPKVYYGQKRAKRGSLSGLIVDIESNNSVYNQYKKLDTIIAQHKTLLLKDSKGRAFMVDISAPTENIMSRTKYAEKITINWVEVDEYND